MTVKGIDTSKYQQAIDWRQVKAAGVDFAYIRVTDDDGLSPDPMFERNWRESKDAGLLRGFYVPFYAWNDPVKVAEKVFSIVDPIDRGDWWMGELPIAIDVEPSKIYKSLEYQWFQLLRTIDEIETRCLVNTIVYTGQPTWDYFVNPNKSFSFDKLPDLWHAGYIWSMPHVTTFEQHWSDGYKPFRLPNLWLDYKLWQWAGDDGRVDGVETACDLDIFNGTYEELVSWGKSHKIPEIDTEGESRFSRVNELFWQGKIGEAVNELLFARVDPSPKRITNQQVFNAFYRVYGGDSYWTRLVGTVGQIEADRMAANRDSAFVELEKLPKEVSDDLP